MLTLNTLDITDERKWAEDGYPYAEWDLLRREAPSSGTSGRASSRSGY